MNKPPLGIPPRFVREYERLNEIIDAVTRYMDGERLIPLEWIAEYNELVKRRSR